jgi:reverse gyrase
MATISDSFCEFFRAATGRAPSASYEYQRRLATGVCAAGPKSLAINVPTGAGKTAGQYRRAHLDRAQRQPGM